jgi:FtsP/CotA-like multicopper oxidase with cupredoxin domain
VTRRQATRSAPTWWAFAGLLATALLGGCSGDEHAEADLDGHDHGGHGDLEVDGSDAGHDDTDHGGLDTDPGSADGSGDLLEDWPVFEDTFQEGSGFSIRQGRLALEARASTAAIRPGRPTAVWGYNGSVPAGPIRVRQGESLTVAFTNRIPLGTTVHWHGIAQQVAYDGVPGLPNDGSAPPHPLLKTGQSRDYPIETGRTGTFWFHPHYKTSEELDRGLQGVILIEEANPPRVDRDLVWVVDDWMLGDDNQIVPLYQGLIYQLHGGIIGNTITVNGREKYAIELPAGALVRLRIVVTSNARTHRIRLPDGLGAQVVASDGGYVQAPYAVTELFASPAERYELVFRVPDRPGERLRFTTENYILPHTLPLAQVVVGPAEASRAPDWVHPAVEIPDRSAEATRDPDFTITLGGSQPPEAVDDNFMWAINGHSHSEGDSMAHDEPLATFDLGREYRIDVDNVNGYRFGHPLHIHGVVFQVLDIGGVAPPSRMWKDTVWLPPESRARLVMRAEPAGQWMVHCHILEHQARGMMSRIDIVAP